MRSDAFLDVKDEKDFNDLALETFHYQSDHIPVYREYLKALKISSFAIKSWKEIPCLPVSFFKSHKIISEKNKAELIFTSSGTTGMINAEHHVAHLSVYEKSFKKGFAIFYGAPEEYCILALLPSYLERTGSSLIYMADHLIKESKNNFSGFYLDQYEELSKILLKLKEKNQKSILLGVTYALLDLAEKFPVNFPELIIMETGGMKGKRKEMLREEVHSILKRSFSVEKIHSEYGMTELLSQAYSKGDGIFYCPPWMKIAIREVNDPFTLLDDRRSGGMNIIDLANIYSCSFLSTQDLGKKYEDESFEILGRFDDSDLRGCNLLVQ